MNRSAANLFWLLLVFAPSIAWALSSDREQPIHIRAASVEINEKTGVSVYTGDVNVTQGSMELTAEELIVYHENGEVNRMEGEGKPATFRQQPDGAAHEVRGEALRIEYDADAEKAYLVGQGHVWRGNDEFLGERIVFDTVESIVHATSGDDDRVRAVIQPRKDKENDSP
ncbi:lipopolysaccharide transport periplasmic protein LptA [Thiohalomonas denitrificans]|uniref:lipopolysaccharide transport periplasmic protein LptA n=1 Tax=Thiohalomonas denitrificans TaxID=415747 RepID=UPI0026EA598F|nr:lipopolysaccharide transport periplasmic protein LptA [Thiohalomonas denitrificans]